MNEKKRKRKPERRSRPAERPIAPEGGRAKRSVETEVQSALKFLKAHSTKATRDGMARYAIPSDNAYGVAMRDIKAFGETLGRDLGIAGALWDTGIYEARMLVSFVADPSQISSAQMDRWVKDFDNWAICDAMCFNLFDRSPYAWSKVAQWSKSSKEFEKRTAFALLWSLTVHDKQASDDNFEQGLVLIERAAEDARNFVKKAVNMALRAVGKRNRALNTARWPWPAAWPTHRTRRHGGWDGTRSASSRVLR